MKIVRWAGPEYRVTANEDKFFSSALNDLTLFRLCTSSFETHSHAGAFSIKLVLAGTEIYRFSRRSVNLKPNEILLVNEGEMYSSCITQPTESLSIFFRPGDVKQAHASLSASAENLLENPHEPSSTPDVPQIAIPFGRRIRSSLAQLTQSIDSENKDPLRDNLDSILLSALEESLNLTPKGALSTVQKRSTRDELLSRIFGVKKMIDEAPELFVDLDELASSACMSRYHFLRVFSEVVGETPTAYVRRKCLERARQDLQRGYPVDLVCKQYGYTSPKSMKRALKRVLGETVLHH